MEDSKGKTAKSEAKPEAKSKPSDTKTEKTGGDDRMRRIKEGFRITYVEMGNEETGEMMWQSTDWKEIFKKEIKITIPADILKCNSVSRTMKFASKQEITKFRLVQRVLLMGQVLEGDPSLPPSV
jgi:hypothetical protein